VIALPGLVQGQGTVVIPPEPPVQMPWETMPPQAVLLIVFGALAACVIVLWPLVRALGRRIEGRGANPAMARELEEWRGRMAEVDHLQGRVAELEERLDFAERMLAQRREPDRLPG
jgi:hypothetical protein